MLSAVTHCASENKEIRNTAALMSWDHEMTISLLCIMATLAPFTTLTPSHLTLKLSHLLPYIINGRMGSVPYYCSMLTGVVLNNKTAT